MISAIKSIFVSRSEEKEGVKNEKLEREASFLQEYLKTMEKIQKIKENKK